MSLMSLRLSRRWRSARSLAAAAAALVLLGSAACEPSTTPAPGYTCRSIPESPHVSSGEKRKGRLLTIAKVRTTCTKLVDSHRLTIGLERQKGDRWVQMASNVDERVPLAGKTQTSDVEWPGCIPGPWRVTIGGRATLGGRSGTIPPVTKRRNIPRAACDLDSGAS